MHFKVALARTGERTTIDDFANLMIDHNPFSIEKLALDIKYLISQISKYK